MRNLVPFKRNRDLSLFGEVDLDRFFEDFFKSPLSLNTFAKGIVPLIDLYEKDDKIIVKAELPGIKAEEIELSIDGNLLNIRGEKKKKDEVKEKDYYRLERSYGFFQRVVELPTEVKASGAKASYKDGLLEVELPKSKEEKKNKIKIEVE